MFRDTPETGPPSRGAKAPHLRIESGGKSRCSAEEEIIAAGAGRNGFGGKEKEDGWKMGIGTESTKNSYLYGLAAWFRRSRARLRERVGDGAGRQAWKRSLGEEGRGSVHSYRNSQGDGGIQWDVKYVSSPLPRP